MADSYFIRGAVIIRLLMAGAALVCGAHAEVRVCSEDFESFPIEAIGTGDDWSPQHGVSEITDLHSLSGTNALALRAVTLPGRRTELVAPIDGNEASWLMLGFSISGLKGASQAEDGIFLKLTGVPVALVTDVPGFAKILILKSSAASAPVWVDVATVPVSEDTGSSEGWLRIEATLDCANLEGSIKIADAANTVTFMIPRTSRESPCLFIGNDMGDWWLDDWSATILTDEDKENREEGSGARKKSSSKKGGSNQSGLKDKGVSNGDASKHADSKKGTGVSGGRIKKSCKIVIISPANGEKV